MIVKMDIYKSSFKDSIVALCDQCFLPAFVLGYTIPLDKRLAADGRGLQQFTSMKILQNWPKPSTLLIERLVCCN